MKSLYVVSGFIVSQFISKPTRHIDHIQPLTYTDIAITDFLAMFSTKSHSSDS